MIDRVVRAISFTLLWILATMLVLFAWIWLQGLLMTNAQDRPQDLQPTPRSLTMTGEWHEFCWDHDSDTADWYQIKIARPGEPWETLSVIQSPTKCWYGDLDTFPPGLVGVVITASNAAGVSATGHGEYFGAP